MMSQLQQVASAEDEMLHPEVDGASVLMDLLKQDGAPLVVPHTRDVRHTPIHHPLGRQTLAAEGRACTSCPARAAVHTASDADAGRQDMLAVDAPHTVPASVA